LLLVQLLLLALTIGEIEHFVFFLFLLLHRLAYLLFLHFDHSLDILPLNRASLLIFVIYFLLSKRRNCTFSSSFNFDSVDIPVLDIS
jgi:hypothetical protein